MDFTTLPASGWRGDCDLPAAMVGRLPVSWRFAEPLLRLVCPAPVESPAAGTRVDRPKPPQEWSTLPVASRCYVATVITLGAAAILLAVPQITDDDAPLVTALVVLTVMTAFAKTALPIPASASTLSFCYVIDFTALLVLGPAAATLTSAVGAWTQSTFRSRNNAARYRTWFSIAALALTVHAAWFTYTRLGGVAGEPLAASALVVLAATAVVYFLSNSLLVAGAVALTTRQRTVAVWRSNYAPIWPGHVFGFCVASAAAAGIARSKLWLFPFTLAILALTYEALHAYVEGLTDSLTDAMTELPNLRYLNRHAPPEIDRARRGRAPLAVLMIDVVDFKTINDTYGHRVGDRALREVARRLHGLVRSYDICARYAGDEFVVVLPGCHADEAQAKAAALQRVVAEAQFEVASGTAVPLEISVGVAVYPQHGETFEELLSVADHAMFENKRAASRNAGRADRKAPSTAARPIVNRGLAPAV